MNKTFTGTYSCEPRIPLRVRVTERKVTFTDYNIFTRADQQYTVNLGENTLLTPDGEQGTESVYYKVGKCTDGTPYELIEVIGTYHGWAGQWEEISLRLCQDSRCLSVWSMVLPKRKDANKLECVTTLIDLDEKSLWALRRWLDELAGRTLC